MKQDTYYSKNREKMLERSKAYYQANKEKAQAYQAEYGPKYREKKRAEATPKKKGRPPMDPLLKKQKMKERSAKYYAENREARRAKQAEWISANKDNLAAYKREYYQRNPNHRIAQNIRSRLRHALNASGAKKVGSAVTLLCMEIPQFREYIAAKFTEGMSWDNYGEWHLDHIIPLVSFDLSDPYQLAQACHYSNYQPLWGVDNSSKGGRIQ